MALPSWKNGASWEALSAAALGGTYAGTFAVEYPPAGDVDGLGNPCGAYGLPRIVIKTPRMTDTGFDFWRDRFSTTTAVYVAFRVEAWDPRTGTLVKWLGKLHRPTFARVAVGSAGASTWYQDVTITVSECEVTT